MKSKWETKKLGEVCGIVKDKPPFFEGEKKYFTTKAINNNGDYSPILVTYKKRPGRANLYPSKGDVGFALMKGTNKVFLVNEELKGSIFSTGFGILKPGRGIDPKFLFILVQSDLFQMGI